MMQSEVTAGWPVVIVGNEPSGRCWLASQSSARLTAVSTRRHSLGGSTVTGAPLLSRDKERVFAEGATVLRGVIGCAAAGATASSIGHAVITKRLKLIAMLPRYRW